MNYIDKSEGFIYIKEKQRFFEVFHDSAEDNREYVCIDDEVVYLETMEEIDE
ncbi:MAG: hypothetical protein ACRC0F_09650 [Cetobacterium sp.]